MNATELGALQFRLIFPDRFWYAADSTGTAQNGQKEEDLLTEMQRCINHREDVYALASDSKIHIFG